MKIYTKTGDGGTTALLSGGRVGKNHPRLDSYGTLDELNSVIGLLRCEPLPDGVDAHLEAIQRALFSVGAALADPEGRYTQGTDSTWEVAPLEQWIDAMEEELPKLKRFILPGGSRAAALAHQARTVCRRGERRVAELASLGRTDPRRRGALPQPPFRCVLRPCPLRQPPLRSCRPGVVALMPLPLSVGHRSGQSAVKTATAD
jgi:cob(I)alamin adenosyltransferase